MLVGFIQNSVVAISDHFKFHSKYILTVCAHTFCLRVLKLIIFIQLIYVLPQNSSFKKSHYYEMYSIIKCSSIEQASLGYIIHSVFLPNNFK